MTNSKTRKTGNSCNDPVIDNNNDDGDIADGVDEVDGVSSAWMQNAGNDCLSPNYSDETDDTEDADDETVNDGDTSTSFSLQECMNEFRARRVRRISSSLNRQESEKGGGGAANCHDTTDLDLINQNLCNKEQERKCKPCKDGFCYCFTSDSGDGGNLGVCGAARGIHLRHSRRNRRTECNQTLISGIQPTKFTKSQEARRHSEPPKLKNPQKQETNKCETSNVGQNLITAISRLETSQNDAPLIHIIQELRDNCVISKVRVNKQKIEAAQCGHTSNGHKAQAAQSDKSNKKIYFKDNLPLNTKLSKKMQHKSSHKSPLEPHTPTAPTLDRISELDTPQSTESKISLSVDDRCNKLNDSIERRHKAGGRLFQKRLSNKHFSYKPRDLKEPPPKPPRTSLSLEDHSSLSNTSTSPSVREAERVVDEFLAKKGFTTQSEILREEKAKALSFEQIKHSKRYENEKRKSYPMTPEDRTKHAKKTLPKYPSLSDIERVVESKKSTQYEKNIRQSTENQPKVISIGWNERKINDMLNYDSNTKCKEFRSAATQAQPQQRSGRDVVGFEERIGWQMPPKIYLDTVDGVERHNLESNIENKNTPVKTKLFSAKKAKPSTQTKKFLWSEQLRHLSPWSNKQCLNKSPDVNRKSNLRSSSKAFIKSSKKKILRLVSPKKENKERTNFQIRKTPQRNVGIQTSRDDVSHHHVYEPSSTPQSPPGSYHSPVQSSQLQSPSSTQSQNTTPNGIDSALSHFDFSRTVHSPPKKAPRSSQRKLNFPLNCSDVCSKEGDDETLAHTQEKKTYRSFNTELEQDVSISKISYILSNIRAKLEASDEHAIRTFRETERIEQRQTGFDCTDGNRGIRQETRVEIHGHFRSQLEQQAHLNDPIYSEIEDGSIYIAESPDFDNHTGLQHFKTDHNPEILYAKVNKPNKRIVDKSKFPVVKQQPTALAKILQDSLKNKKITTCITPLPPLPEPPESETASYSSPTSISMTGLLLHCQSLNNVRVMEHNSPPKRQRNLSKSDLSLHRSEIFHENLCKSELIILGGTDRSEHLEKIENKKTNQSYIAISQPSPTDRVNTSSESDQQLLNNDTVSYEMPNDVDAAVESIDADDSTTTAGSNLGLNTIDPPSSHNQSTPKKQSFTTKDNPKTGELNIDVMPNDSLPHNENLSMSCPSTPHKLADVPKLCKRQPSLSHSLNAVSEYKIAKKSNAMSITTLRSYKCLKNVLQKSFRKSKQFVKAEGKRLSTSLSFSQSTTIGNQTLAQSTHSPLGSSLDLEALFSLNETSSVSEQLAQTVSICRKLPDLEISSEMVEAERLLLFSALRCENQRILSGIKSQTMNQQPKMCFFIDDMYLPIRADVNQDIFFNYFYIITFECGGIIKSTQSAECQNGSAVFRECGIEFVLCSELNTNESSKEHHAIRCNVFMLRLRKVSTLLFEPKKRKITETITSPSLSSSVSSTSSLSSSNAIVSRFRLHASFTLDSTAFVPYEYVPQESNNSDRICVRASCTSNIPLIPRTKSTNLSRQLQLKGRAEIRFPKRSFAGFLNVEDPHSQHNWNRRWCSLDGIFLHVWLDVNHLNQTPLITLDLRDSKHDVRHPLTLAPRELCARPRSFCLECTIRKADEDISTATVFFAAETQGDLDDWLKNINISLDLIITWLS